MSTRLDVPSRCWLDPRVEVRSSPIHGLGLFARSPILRGEVVAVMGGQVIDDAELHRIAASGGRYNSAAIAEGVNILLDNDEPLARGNHSCDPNLWMRDAVRLEARRDIGAGEELTSDYALMTAVGWTMECHCGSRLCRGVVRGSDWTRDDLRVRYRGHFAPFLNDRIADRPS